MLHTEDAVTLLRALRPATAVTTPNGTGLVLAQVRNLVTVVERGVVRVYERHEVEVAQ